MSEYRLEMKNINKSFVSTKALSDVDFQLLPGEAHALLGMNGAGKSVLIKIISGVYAKDSGQMFVRGDEVSITSPQDAMDLGISTVYQHPLLAQSLTVFENIFLGTETSDSKLLRKIDRKELQKKAETLAAAYNIDLDVSKTVSDLKAVERELTSILCALSRQAEILILDEPTSILTEKEKTVLFDVIRDLKKKGVSIIFVTHRLDEVNEICDRLTVLRNGENVKTMTVGQGSDPSVIAELMLGKKLEKLYPEKNEGMAGEVVFKAEELGIEQRFQDVNIEARTNEILGVFGLVGSGIEELSKVLFGTLHNTSGKMFLNGKEIKIKSPRNAINNNIFLVPGDRQTEGYIGEQSIANNVIMSKIDKATHKAFGLINTTKRKNDSIEMINRLNIATTNEQKIVAELSGGNQQKVVVGKGLYTDANVYIFCEPTIGVDVGARNSIYEIMRGLSKNAVVILISSDIEEVYGMSDRIIVINQGKVMMESKTDDVTLNNILVNAVSVN